MVKRKKLLLFLFVASVIPSAQLQASPADRQAEPPAATAVEVTGASDSIRQGVVKTTEDYKTSLQELARLHDQSLKRLSEQNAAMKELFQKGLVSRRDLEQSDQSLAEARAKADDIQKQIASAGALRQGASQTPTTAAVARTAQTAPRAWTTGDKKVDGLIRYYGELHGVDPYLIYCVMRQESDFNPRAVSYKGAQGLMQLMPATAARFGVSNPYDPAQSIMGGTRYLKFLLDKFNGDVALALAGYNAGEGAVMKYGIRVPPYRETQAYVRSISARYLGKQT